MLTVPEVGGLMGVAVLLGGVIGNAVYRKVKPECLENFKESYQRLNAIEQKCPVHEDKIDNLDKKVDSLVHTSDIILKTVMDIKQNGSGKGS